MRRAAAGGGAAGILLRHQRWAPPRAECAGHCGNEAAPSRAEPRVRRSAAAAGVTALPARPLAAAVRRHSEPDPEPGHPSPRPPPGAPAGAAAIRHAARFCEVVRPEGLCLY
ncbi:uncharacterized protein C11orf96-like [Falco biarmicus]|uniref:uncharacterized protein C11orf96-like n=1 Tax=Falco biarmicus TaxID=345155 RepID=UPI0024BC5379|nr:uncharacterized protein C11orf96-like [Falco biarmicus]